MACAASTRGSADQNCAQRWEELKSALIARGAPPKAVAEAALASAEVERAAGRWRAARRSLRAALAAADDAQLLAQAYVGLGYVELDDARLVAERRGARAGGATAPLALGPLRAALALRPQYAAAHRGLGAALLPAGAADLAEEPHLTLAREALAHTSAAAALNPNCALLHLQRGALGMRTRAARAEELVSAFEGALRVRPASAAALQHVTTALQWAGRRAEADAAARRGVALGLWANPWQRPAKHVAGLTAKPWWAPSAAAPGLCRRLRAHHAAIAAELAALRRRAGGCAPQDEGLHDARNGSWRVCDVMKRCRAGGAARDAVAATCAALRLAGVDDPGAERGGWPMLSVQFSVLDGGSHVRPHTGTSNRKLVLHYGVAVPDGALLRAAARWRPFRHAACIAFDDSFEHEVRHLGAGPRATLVVQVVHPDLRGDYYDFMTR